MSPTSPSSGTVNTVSSFGSGVNENAFLIDGTNFHEPVLAGGRPPNHRPHVLRMIGVVTVWIQPACASALLSAALVAGCSSGHSAADASSAPSIGQAGTLSVTAFRVSGWHDESFHYMPALSVTAPSTGRPVFVEGVDFTADDSGTRRLLKGVRYAVAPRVQPGSTVALVPTTGAADPAEIASPFAVASISAMVFFTDDDGQPGIVSAVARVPDVSDLAPRASVEIRQFTVSRRQDGRRFLYSPSLTLAETSGRSRASIRKVVFELLDVGVDQPPPIWTVPPVPAGGTIGLVTSRNVHGPWFEIDSRGEAWRMSVAISFVDDAGRGGLVSAIASVQR